MPERTRIAIIGAGPTGLSAAWRLEELGERDWLLLEAGDQPGGLACSVVDDAGFTWDMGGHVVFSHYEYFDNLLDTLLGDAWFHHVRESWVWMRQRFIPYPFQLNIWKLPPQDLQLCIDGLLELHGRANPAVPGTPGTSTASSLGAMNFGQWIDQQFGRGIAEVFMTPYNRKVWAYDPSRLSAGWMGERVAPVDLRRCLHNLIHQRDDVSWGPNARFRFPQRGGTGAIWHALANRLPADRLRLRSTVTAIDSASSRLRLSDGREIQYDHLLTTIPLEQLLRRITDLPRLQPLADQFVYSSTHVIGFGVDGPLPESLATKCWIYFPEAQFPFYRMTVFSNYSKYNVPIPGRHTSLMCEVSESPDKPVDATRVVAECEASLRESGLLPADAPVISRFHRRLHHGYPTPFVGRDELLEQVDPPLKARRILTRGRFGGWRYEVANQDHSAMQGVEAVNHILRGTPEVTFYSPNRVNRKDRLPVSELPGK